MTKCNSAFHKSSLSVDVQTLDKKKSPFRKRFQEKGCPHRTQLILPQTTAFRKLRKKRPQAKKSAILGLSPNVETNLIVENTLLMNT